MRTRGSKWCRAGCSARAFCSNASTAVPWRQHDRRLYDMTVTEPRLTAEYRHLRNVPESAPDAIHALLEALRPSSTTVCG